MCSFCSQSEHYLAPSNAAVNGDTCRFCGLPILPGQEVVDLTNRGDDADQIAHSECLMDKLHPEGI